MGGNDHSRGGRRRRDVYRSRRARRVDRGFDEDQSALDSARAGARRDRGRAAARRADRAGGSRDRRALDDDRHQRAARPDPPRSAAGRAAHDARLSRRARDRAPEPQRGVQPLRARARVRSSRAATASACASGWMPAAPRSCRSTTARSRRRSTKSRAATCARSRSRSCTPIAIRPTNARSALRCGNASRTSTSRSRARSIPNIASTNGRARRSSTHCSSRSCARTSSGWRTSCASAGVRAPLYVMQSGGGMASVEEAAARPATLIESGPASGVIGAAFVGRLLGIENVLSFDMGGTTAKAGTIVGGEPQVTAEFEAAGRTHSGRAVKARAIRSAFRSSTSPKCQRRRRDDRVHRRRRRAARRAAVGGRRPRAGRYGKRRSRDGHRRERRARTAQSGARCWGARCRSTRAVRAPRSRALCTRLGGRASTKRRPGSCTDRRWRWRRSCASSRSNAGTTRATSRCSRSAAAARCMPAPWRKNLQVARVIVPGNPGLFSAFGLLTADVRSTAVQSIVALAFGFDAAQAEGCSRAWNATAPNGWRARASRRRCRRSCANSTCATPARVSSCSRSRPLRRRCARRCDRGLSRSPPAHVRLRLALRGGRARQRAGHRDRQRRETQCRARRRSRRRIAARSAARNARRLLHRTRPRADAGVQRERLRPRESLRGPGSGGTVRLVHARDAGLELGGRRVRTSRAGEGAPVIAASRTVDPITSK